MLVYTYPHSFSTLSLDLFLGIYTSCPRKKKRYTLKWNDTNYSILYSRRPPASSDDNSPFMLRRQENFVMNCLALCVALDSFPSINTIILHSIHDICLKLAWLHSSDFAWFGLLLYITTTLIHQPPKIILWQPPSTTTTCIYTCRHLVVCASLLFSRKMCYVASNARATTTTINGDKDNTDRWREICAIRHEQMF